MTVTGRAKPVVIAMSARESGRRGNQRLDLRLVATPLRYKVQRFDYQRHKVGSIQGTMWVDTVWRMPRTRNKWIDWEYDCAVRMFERRCWEKWRIENHELWPSQDGRLTQLRNLRNKHLENIAMKIVRNGWRQEWLPHIQLELERRNLMVIMPKRRR